ncbi:hypothetical protein NMY22_g17497 [Coprinellus aureogranulatus]|nr:hypothetical protein NMY22_g17497 [Coprinellus aureogranulatus]
MPWGLSDIRKAISVQELAIRQAPKDSSGLAGIHNNLANSGNPNIPVFLNNLGASLLRHFEFTGDLANFYEAILAHRKAVALTPQSHPSLPLFLVNLGNALLCRYEHTHDLSDIDEGVINLRRAVEHTPKYDIRLSGFLPNLGNALFSRFERTGSMDDIMESMTRYEEAVSLTSHDYPSLPTMLTNITIARVRYFEYSGDLADIEAVVTEIEQAVKLTPEGHRDAPGRMSSLGNILLRRFDCTGRKPDVDEAISAIKKAVGLVPFNHSSAPTMLSNLGNCYHSRFVLTGDEEDLRASLFSDNQPDSAINYSVGPLKAQLSAGQARLRYYSATLLTPPKASPQSMLYVSYLLENAGSSRSHPKTDMWMLDKISLEEEARTHINLEELLTTARYVPAFESFLLPPLCSTLLRDAPEDGPVVIVNVHERRCDAIALVSGIDEPIQIPLLSFSLDKANTHGANLSTQLSSHSLHMRSEYAEYKVEHIHAAATRAGIAIFEVQDVDLTIEDCLAYMTKFSGVHFACHAS